MKTLLPRIATIACFIGVAHAANSPFENVRFEPNRGQTGSAVRFIGRLPGGNVAFTDSGVEFQCAGCEKSISMRWEGMAAAAHLEATDATTEPVSYFLGADPSRWVRDVPRFRRIIWRGLFPGIDAVFYGDHGKLEYDLIVAPGADPSAIRMRFARGVRLAHSSQGDLTVRQGQARFVLQQPVLYQLDARGARHGIGGGYGTSRDGRVWFKLGHYDRTRPLVIDPVVQFSSLIGGERDDTVAAITSFGDIVGTTSSLSFGDGSVRRGRDVFVSVAVLAGGGGGGAGSFLVFAGGSDDDVATSAVATTSQITIGGWTRSSDFLNSATLGGTDGFFLTVSRTPSSPFANLTRIGGSGEDRVLAMSGTSFFFFAGDTNSPDLKLNGAPLSTQLAGGYDAFVGFGFSVTGVQVRSLAYYGGSGDDSAYAVSSVSTGVAIAGKTNSTDLPLADPIAGQLSGASDGFLAVLDAQLVNPAPVFATYLGGSGDDEIRALIAVSGVFPVLYFAGTTTSADFPVLNAAQPQYGGGESDAFLGKLDLTTHKLLFSTYAGGSGRDEAVALGSFGGLAPNFLPLEPVLAGITTSPDFPLRDASQTQLAGPQDAFVAQFDSSGTILFATYFGGSGSERVNAVYVDTFGQILIGGETDSDDLPAASGSPSPLRAGAVDGFTASIAPTRISATSSTLWTGADLTVYTSVFLSLAIPDSALVRITSSDPSRVVIGTFAEAAGVGSLAISAGNLRRLNRLAVTGLADEGESSVIIAADDFPGFTIRVRLGQPVVRFSNNGFNLVPGQSFTVIPSLGVIDDTGFFWYATPRFGQPSIRVKLAISDPALGTLDKSEVALPAAGVFENAQVTFIAANPGEGTLSLVSSSGPPISNPSSIPISVRNPKLTFNDIEIGKNLSGTMAVIADPRVGDSRFNLIITSSDPNLVCLSDPSGACMESIKVVPGNGFAVVGLSDSGTAQIRYANALLGEGSATVTLTRPVIGLSRFGGLTTPLPLGQFRTMGFEFASSSGVLGSLRPGTGPQPAVTASDPKIITVSEITATGFKITAVGPGQATLNISAPGFDAKDPVTITVVNPTLALSVSSSGKLIGQNLQVPFTVSAPTQGVAPEIRVRSSNPKVLVSTSSFTAGAETATAINGFATIYVQSLTDSGTATITISSTGYEDAQITYRLTPSGFAWSALQASVSTYSNSAIAVFSYALDPDSLLPLTIQSLRPGLTARPSFSSSNPSVGTVGFSGINAFFTAGEPGITDISLTQPEGFASPSARTRFRIAVNRASPNVSVPAIIGKDLQFPINPRVGFPSTPLTVRSDDPSLLLVSTSSSEVGRAEVTMSGNQTVYLQALAASGTVTLRISGDKVAESLYPIALGPVAVRIEQSGFGPPPAVTTLSGDMNFAARLYINLPAPSSPESYTVRPGADPINVGIVSTNPSVARALQAGLVFQPGGQTGLNFAVRPLNAGETVIRLVPPPELPGAVPPEFTFKVGLPTFIKTAPAISVGRNLVLPAPLSLTPGVALPGAILVTLTSSDPSRLLVSGAADQTGKATAIVAYGNNNSSFSVPIGYLHGVSDGPATLTVSASGFEAATFDVQVSAAVVTMTGVTATVVGRDSVVSFLTDPQTVRPGASISIPAKSSNPSVVAVDSPAIFKSGARYAEVPLHPVGVGKATISADPPDGVVMSPTAASFDVAVRLPPFPASVSDRYEIGKNLQFVQSINPFERVPASITITSSDPSKLLISTDPKAAGQASVSIGPPNFPTIYLQALSDSGQVKVTFSTPGFESKESTVTLYPSSVTFNASVLSYNKSLGVLDLQIGFRMLNPAGGFTNLALRGGFGPLNVIVSSGTPAVGTPAPTLPINPGDYGATIKFTPVSAGSTVLTIQQPPGFVSPASLGQCVITVF